MKKPINMGLLTDQFRKKVKYNYGYSTPITIYDYMSLSSTNIIQGGTSNSSNNNTSNNTTISTEEAAFIGYVGGYKTYGLHKWYGNYDKWNGKM
jgi:hypothetical protein